MIWKKINNNKKCCNLNFNKNFFGFFYINIIDIDLGNGKMGIELIYINKSIIKATYIP